MHEAAIIGRSHNLAVRDDTIHRVGVDMQLSDEAVAAENFRGAWGRALDVEHDTHGHEAS